MTLPFFKYHPDPLATGSIAASDAACACCGQARGFVYTASVYAVDDVEPLCPWCIADGSAAARFDACFSDDCGVGACGDGLPVPPEVVEIVSRRTPGYATWQQEQWWTHCGDAGMFLGPAGRAELEAFGPEAAAAIRAEAGLPEGPAWNALWRALDKDHGPTAYVFRCTVCGALGGYYDSL